MKRITYFICILAILQLACGFVPLATSTPAPIEASAQPAISSPIPPKNKPTNAPDSAYPYKTTVTADLLNIRMGPSHRYEVIPSVWLMHGESVTVLECSGLWARIGATRWVNSIYLEMRCE